MAKISFWGTGMNEVVIDASTPAEMARSISEHPGIPAHAEFDAKKNVMTIHQWWGMNLEASIVEEDQC